MNILSKPNAGGVKVMFPAMIVFLITSVVILQFGFIFLLLATLPTVVVYFTDTVPGKPSFKIVGSCNVAATLPYLAPMVHMGIHFKHYDVSFILGDMSVWLIVYSAAAGGWCLIFLSRLIANVIVIMTFEYSRNALEKAQEQLVDEWGKKVMQIS